MSSLANFFRTLPETLQQPTALAMLGSVGAHLLIFATLPAFTSSSEPRPEAEVRRVRLLEPPQGSNPQASSSQLALPPVPNTPSSKTQLPITAQGRSPVPNPLYTIPDLNSPLPLNPPPPIPIPSQPQVSQADRFNELLRRLAARQAQVTPPKPTATQPPSQSDISISPSSSLPGLTPANPSDIAKVTPPPPGTSSPAPTATQSPAPTATQSPAPTATQSPASTASNDRLLAAIRYSPEGTSQQDGIQAAQKLTEEFTTKGTPWEYVRLRQPQEPIKELDYPLTFPLNNYKQHPTAIAIFVGKDGKPLADRKPQILNSTGYPILNDKAIEYVQKDASQPNRFPPIAEDKIRVFVYEFQFKAPNTGTASRTSPQG